MKIFGIAAMLAMVTVAACQNPELKFLSAQIKREKLPNGLNILFVEDHRFPVISYQSWFKVGSVDERLGITGISHLFEHLMFKGTEKYGPKAFFRELEAKGAEVNAYTTRDYTVYYENFVPSLLEQVVLMEADRLKNMKFDEASLATERQVVFEERRLKSDNSPGGKMSEALWQLAFSRHPYQWPVVGYPEDLLSIKVPDLEDYFKKHYHPGNLTLVLVGDFDSQIALSLLKLAYGSIPGSGPNVRKIDPEPQARSERRLELKEEIASQRFMQAYPITAASNEESYSLDVLANILFEGSSSRVSRKLVEELQIVSHISGTAFTPTYPGLFLMSGIMKGDLPTAVAEKEIDKLLIQIQKQGVSKDEIQVAVKQLTLELLNSVQTPYGLGQFMGTVEMVLGGAEHFESEITKYLKVTPEKVKAVANRYLVPNGRVVVTMVKPSTEKSGSKP